MEKTKFESSKPLTLDSPLKDILDATINSQQPKGVVRFKSPDGKAVTFMCVISDEEGYMRAIQAYEEGRDGFTLRAVNAVLDHVRANGVPKTNDELNLVLHS